MLKKREPGRRRHPDRARTAAWRILSDWERRKGPLEGLRDRALSESSYSHLDRALIMELTQGVPRHRLIIDHWILNLLDRPGRDLPIPVLTALRLGIYQLLFLHKIPAHAAVGATVNLVKRSEFEGFAPLVNAVLRRAASTSLPPVPEAGEDPLHHLEVVTSSPGWLVDRLVKFRGLAEARLILQALNRPGPLTMRANTLRIDRESLLDKLDSLGVSARAGRLSPDAVILGSGTAPAAIPPFQNGLCTVQDEGAQLIAPLLGPEPGERLLDACAAPGGKAGHLAQLVGDDALILAVDHSRTRVSMMTRSLARLRVTCVRAVVADARNLPILSTAPVNGVLVDAPCSGTGVLRRHPEGKWRKDAAGVVSLIQIQEDLISAASAVLPRGGRLLYTTCSILREENEDVVDRTLARGSHSLADLRKGTDLPDDLFTARGEMRTWPHLHDCDGFYAALLVKET